MWKFQEVAPRATTSSGFVFSFLRTSLAPFSQTLSIFLQVQDNSPGYRAGLEAFFDFILAIGKTRLVGKYSDAISQISNAPAFTGPRQ